MANDPVSTGPIADASTGSQQSNTPIKPLRRPQENDKIPHKQPDHILTYGALKQQFAHLRLPDSRTYGPGPYPTIVVFHGGCWFRPYASLTNSAALADALRDAGYATLNAEYRTTDEPAGGWTGTFEDVSRLMDSLPVFAQTYPLDLSKLATTGHSAGGHLALWAMARSKLPPSSPLYFKGPFDSSARSLVGTAAHDKAPTQMVIPQGSVILGGPADLLQARPTWAKGCGIDSITTILDGDENRDKNAAHGSPAELMPFPGHQIFLTGTRDSIVPPSVGRAYMGRINKLAPTSRDAHDTRDHRILQGSGHHDYLNPADPTSWPAILDAFEDIFKS